MKRIILFLSLILLLSSCKKVAPNVAGAYQCQKICAFGMGPADTSNVTLMVMTIDDNNISITDNMHINAIELQYVGNYTFSGGMPTCTAIFDHSSTHVTYYYQLSHLGCTFTGSK